MIFTNLHRFAETDEKYIKTLQATPEFWLLISDFRFRFRFTEEPKTPHHSFNEAPLRAHLSLSNSA